MNYRLFSAFVASPIVAAAAFSAVNACSSTTEPGVDAGTSDTSVASDAGTDVEVTDSGTTADACSPYTGMIPNDAGVLCHDLPNTADLLEAIADPGTLPAGIGGKPADGLYHATEVRTFSGSPIEGTLLRHTVLVVGDTRYSVQGNDPATMQRRITKTNPDGGPDILICERNMDNPVTYSSSTATCDTLTRYSKDLGFSMKLTRQP